MNTTNKNVKYPCRGCKFFRTCGDRNRTVYCGGRELDTANSKRTKKR